ncbi:MAG TPA: DNA adenine methylase, partial [Longimicrobiales bacterium]|nr:DNA adenine methylase [Longimicrobiales bacterium]
MRYIGNKTRLLGFIRRVLRQRAVAPGRALDPFCGTASVARALKRWGFSVVAADVMRYAYVFGRAYVETAAHPRFAQPVQLGYHRVRSFSALLRALADLPPLHGFTYQNFTPASSTAHRRMYFTPENGARIDAIRTWLHDAQRNHLLSDDAFYLLLAALIEAADRVANTTGVYAAYVKSWQPNAVRALELRPERIIAGNSCHAYQQDAVELVAGFGPFDLLYLDPPYNTRQYPGYYHVPELIATGWFEQPPALRGKTGLLPDAHLRSVWCSVRKAEAALETLLASAECRDVVMSYNAEGIIPESTIERLLKEFGRRATYQRYRHTYRRYRADADGENRK